MDRKEERRNQFARKKKFKKYTRSSKAKTARKKTDRREYDVSILEQIMDDRA
jgi:hypothetical protein